MKLRLSRIGAWLVASALAFTSGSALAQYRAVEALNFEAALESVDSDTADSTSNGTLGGKLRGTVPLGELFAVALSGSYAESRVRTREVVENDDGTISGIRPSCNFDSTSGEVSLFARRPTLGRIGVSYGVGQLGSDCSEDSSFIPTSSDSLDTDYYRVDAEFYWRDFTLGASHTTTTLEQGPELETTALSASWYPLDSLRVSLFGSDLYDEDTYGLVLEHQPEFLGDGFGVRLGYSTADTEPSTRTISLGVSYYFGAKVPLKMRDRQYR